MFNQRIDPPSWAIELPGSDIPAEPTGAQNAVPQGNFMPPYDQRPTLQVPRLPPLKDDSHPLSAPVTGLEPPRWQYTISPVAPYNRREDMRSQQNPQTTSNPRPNLVRTHGSIGG